MIFMKTSIAASCLFILLTSCGGSRDIGKVKPVSPPSPVTFDAIQASLDANPALAFGVNLARSQAITDFDGLLAVSDETKTTSADITNYYIARSARVATEMEQAVTVGFRVWAMYNHGFIVKTPTTTFAFDLVEGKSSWNGPAWTTQLPKSILNKIDVLFVSHEHGDHYDLTERIPAAIKAHGGAVVYPKAGLAQKNTTVLMSNNEQIQLKGLQIRSFDGLHNAPNLVYEVVTAQGYKIVHTGDTQTSLALPQLNNIHLLLLNGWLNESGSTNNIEGIKDALDKLRPDLMIPGHFEELAHPRTGDLARYHYTDALRFQNSPAIRSKTVILTWGEHIDYTEPTCISPLVRIYHECKSLEVAAQSDSVPDSINLQGQFPVNSEANFFPSGIAGDSQSIWISNYPATITGQKRIFRYKRSTGEFLDSIPTPSLWASNLCYVDGYIWLTDYVDGGLKIIKISANDGAIVATSPAIQTTPAHAPAGIAWDGSNLYYAESVNNQNTGELGSTIYKIDPLTGKSIATIYTSTVYKMNGLTFRNGSFWFISSIYGNGTIVNKLVNISGKGVELSVKNLPVHNIQGLMSGIDYLLYIDGRQITKFNIFGS
jgi:L-ascorbate metabolism protein UlaG (beta-lactamase superfamily)